MLKQQELPSYHPTTCSEVSRKPRLLAVAYLALEMLSNLASETWFHLPSFPDLDMVFCYLCRPMGS